MGRRARPVELLLMKGGKHLTKKEIQERREGEARLKPPTDKVKPPPWLDREGKREWKRVAGILKDLGLLTNIDVSALAVYCDAVSKYAQATRALQEEGLVIEYTNKFGATNMVQNPNVLVAARYAQLIRQLVAEFGLTPSARAKLALPRDNNKQPKDKFEELFGG